MRIVLFFLKLLLKILMAPVLLALTLFIWICVGIVYLSGLVLGLVSTIIAFLGVVMLIVGPRQNGIIALVMAFLISPFGLPMAAIWLLGKVQDLKFAIHEQIGDLLRNNMGSKRDAGRWGVPRSCAFVYSE